MATRQLDARAAVTTHPATGALLSLVAPRDRALVRAVADRLAAGYTGPAAGAGLYDTRLAALTVAAMAPTLRHDKLRLLLRYCAFTIHLDARIDAVDATPAVIRRVADSVSSIVDRRRPAADPLEEELATILAALRGYDPDGRQVARFAGALRDAVAADVAHLQLSRRVASGQARLPTPERYLRLAGRNVNYRSVALALLILVGETPSPAGHAQLDAAITHASLAVRLANDLRTVGKDRTENRLNILTLRTGTGTPVSAWVVDNWVDQHVQAHSELLVKASRTGLRESTRALTNSLRMAVGLYRLAGPRKGGTSHAVRHRRGPTWPR